jgi:mycothiol synthase
MTIAMIDERQLPAMYMVWPLNRLPAPMVAVPAGYVVRRCLESDMTTVRTLIDAEGPINDKAWDFLVDRIVPGGAFLISHAETGKPVATACAVHNPRATRYYFPFGGEVGYVTVDARHQRKGLGRAVVALVVSRLIEVGYHHVFVGVQGWRLPAIKCYLSLGFVPLVHDDELLPRWRRLCEQIGWAVKESEWPKSVDASEAQMPSLRP